LVLNWLSSDFCHCFEFRIPIFGFLPVGASCTRDVAPPALRARSRLKTAPTVCVGVPPCGSPLDPRCCLMNVRQDQHDMKKILTILTILSKIKILPLRPLPLRGIPDSRFQIQNGDRSDNSALRLTAICLTNFLIGDDPSSTRAAVPPHSCRWGCSSGKMNPFIFPDV